MPDSLLTRFRILSRTLAQFFLCQSGSGCFFYFSVLLTCLISGPGIKCRNVPHPEPDTGPIYIRILSVPIRIRMFFFYFSALLTCLISGLRIICRILC